MGGGYTVYTHPSDQPALAPLVPLDLMRVVVGILAVKPRASSSRWLAVLACMYMCR